MDSRSPLAHKMTLPLFPSGPPEPPHKLPPTLRPYQQRAIRALQLQVVSGKKRIILVSPCGSGKMVLAAYIIRTATVPVLFVCHLRELIDQCVDQLARQNITNVGVVRGDDERFNPSASVQLGSVQTLVRREPLFPPETPIVVLVDEAHRCAGNTYRRILSQYPNAIVLGFTATPTRLDGKPLGGDLFQAIEIVATYGELLKNPDWLVGPDVFSTDLTYLKSKLAQVAKVGGDYQEDQLSAVMQNKILRGNAVNHWLRLAHMHPTFTADGHRVPMQLREGPRRKTFCFCVGIEHSQFIAEGFEQAGVRVAHLDGKTPNDQRKSMLRDLASGALEVICNCNILLEGVDLPSLKCIVHCRPTKSLVLWMQSTARAFRPWEGIRPLLLDHAGNFDEHGSPTEDRHWSLSHNARRMASTVLMKLCPVCFAYVATSLTVCPYCGHVFAAGESRSIQQTEEELVQRNTDPASLKEDYFQKMASLARSRGYKPGFASAKWKEKYGSWPERSWSDGLKRIFETDGQWQTLLAAREAGKAERAAAEAHEQKMWDAPGGVTIGENEPDPWGLKEPTDAPFADWLREQGIGDYP